MAETVNFDEVHERSAVIDIGAQKIFVSPDGQEAPCLLMICCKIKLQGLFQC